jgi:transposase-like protein
LKRSSTAQHIVSRVEKARRLDPHLTIKGAARELGISQSSYYKMRAGTRSGQGSIFKRIMTTPPGGVVNRFTVTYQAGGRTGSRNISALGGAETRADALLMQHDPRFKKQLKKQLALEARTKKGEHYKPLTRSERASLRITEVRKPRHARAPAFFVQGRSDFAR